MPEERQVLERQILEVLREVFYIDGVLSASRDIADGDRLFKSFLLSDDKEVRCAGAFRMLKLSGDLVSTEGVHYRDLILPEKFDKWECFHLGILSELDKIELRTRKVFEELFALCYRLLV